LVVLRRISYNLSAAVLWKVVMKKELTAIDVSSIEELQRFKAEQDVVLERLKLMDEKRESVSDEVFNRVQVDYKNRLKSLDDEADPLKEQARLQYAELKMVLEEIDASVATEKLDREELQLRHDLGEFTDEEFAKHIKEQDARVARHQKDLAEAEGIRDRFLSAFHTEEELEVSQKKPSPPPPAGSQETKEEKPEKHETLSVDPSEQTVVGVPLPKTPAKTKGIPLSAKEPDGATMILQWPKLLVHSDSGHAEEHAVVGTGTILGSGEDCDIVLVGKKVSERHAEIALGPNGHLIRDLKSQVGTLVNGVEVSERELANGDTIQLGEVKLTFTV
jgi:hypothetical protein